MAYAYTCPTDGRCFANSEAPVTCASCGGVHIPYECGAPAAEKGLARVAQFKKQFDWALGREVSSAAEMDQLDKSMGLVRLSLKEAKERGHFERCRKGTITSYAGQTRRSTSDLTVRTADGRAVI